MTTEAKHISVCICTFKRPELLKMLLEKLVHQRTDGLFSYSAVVVDNDHRKSAENVVEEFKKRSNVDVQYHVEPEQNIALARNRAVENSTGDFVAFIDDDEFPESDWLFNLFSACNRLECDGILGPVKPFFGEDCPKWIIKANICERKEHRTGTVMRSDETRTGNLLLKREIFDDPDNRFQREFGRTGGEDVWFFVKVIGKGGIFRWCNEAPVYEVVPPERWKASFYLKRFIRLGGLSGEEVRTMGINPSATFPREIAVFCVYASLLPFAGLLGKHLFMKFLMKSVYHFSWLSGYLGHVPIRLRDD